MSLVDKFKKKVQSKVLSTDIHVRSKQLYNTAGWKTLRISTLQIRGGLCEYCTAKNIVKPATEVDHIIPHRGNLNLFYDSTNLQILCKECHADKTRVETMAEDIHRNQVKTSARVRVLACPPGYDYRPHVRAEYVLDEYALALETHGCINKQTLLIAKQNKKRLLSAEENKDREILFICREFSHNERVKLINSLGLTECDVVVPESYLISEDYRAAAEHWLKRLTLCPSDKVIRKS